MVRAVKWMMAALCFTYTCVAVAQVSVSDNFNQLIKPRTEISTLGPDLFGDKVQLYTGTTSFEQTDVSIPGNNELSVSVGRRFVVEERGKSFGYYPGAFSDWDLDIPHLHGVFPAATGWQVSTSTPNARCSVPAQFATQDGLINATPPLANGTNSGLFASAEYWNGNWLYIPGQGEKAMMVVDPGNSHLPTDGKHYPWVTEDHWVFSCLPSTANGVAGEAFLAQSPTGLTYTFDWFVSRDYFPLEKPVTVCTVPQPQCETQLTRSEVWVLPTRVQDRFGNWVKYTYDSANPWRLTNISSSDERSADLTYDANGHVSTVAAGGQVWQYSYGSSGGLSTVTLPDNGGAWQLNFTGALSLVSSTSLHSDCGDPPSYTGGTGQATITHPSGAVGTFSFSAHAHGRSYVPLNCTYLIGGAGYASESDVINVVSIDKKVIDGAGFSTPMTWTYSYGADNRSFAYSCTDGSCPSTKQVTIANPDGSWERHTFSNKYNAAEGKPLEVETGSGSNVLRTESISYLLDATGQPYPAIVGKSPCNRCDHEGWQPIPVKSQVISQDGVTYTTMANSFDAFARTLNVTKSSSIGFTKTDTTEYADNASLWVLSQVSRTTTNGIETASTAFDTATALPTQYYKFGQLSYQYGYAADGTLKTMTDGRNFTTGFSNWKRGIPQLLAYPDSYSQALEVSDLGYITSVTDKAGNKTSYTYDGIGRVTRIDYPAGDEIAWYPSQYTYTFVPTAERGIGANHWKRTIVKGNSVVVTYFDAWLRSILTDAYASTDPSSHSNQRVDFDWREQETFRGYPVGDIPDLQSITNGTHTTYDALKRKTRVDLDSEQGLLSTTTTYLQGQLGTTITDPKGNSVTTNYQAFDDASYESPVRIAYPEGVTQVITRDPFDGILSIVQSGVYGGNASSITRNFYYDANHRVCRIYSPESGSKVMSYDQAGNISWSAEGQSINTSDCGASLVADTDKTVFGYDSIDHVTSEQPPVGTQSTLYSYDPNGNVISTQSGISNWVGVRNGLGLLTSETSGVTGNGNNVVRYAHDAYGSLKTITYPDGTLVDYAPDPLGRATQAGSYATGATYFPDGNLQYFKFGNGTSYLAQYNLRQLPSNISYAKANELDFSEDLAYDGNGNLAGVNDLTGGQRTKAFGYDGLDRVASSHASQLWGDETYAYDPLNNLRVRTLNNQVFTYDYDLSNRLSSVSGVGATVNLSHDNRGNVIGRNSSVLSFDQKNQMLSFGGVDTYAYDANGRRVQRSPLDGSGSVFYFYNQQGQLLYQYEASTTKMTDYIYLGKKLIARSENYASSIRGLVSGVATDGQGNASVTGWACSYGNMQSVYVDLYVGGPAGAHLGQFEANAITDASVASSCGVSGGSFGFSVALSQSVRSQYAGQGIYIYGSNSDGSDRLLLPGAGGYTVPALPSVPPSPANVSAVTSGDLSSIAVSWSTVTGASSYSVQQHANGGAWAQVYSGTSASFSFSVPADGVYTFQAQACNLAGCSTPTVSNAATVAHIPTTPASISAPATGNGPLSVSWASAAYATSYSLEQSVNGGGWVGVYSGGALSYSTLLSVSGTYTYRIKACNANGCGGYATSGGVVVTIPPSGSPTLSAPSTVYSASYSVSWVAVGGATGYELQERANGGAWTTVQNSSAISWVASGKVHNVTYGYQVRACNSGGCGPWSSTANVYVWLLPSTPSAPTLSASPGGHLSSVGSTWPAVANATTYQVEVTAPGEGVRPVVTVSSPAYGWVAHYTGSAKERIAACNSYGCSAWSGYGSVLVTVSP